MKNKGGLGTWLREKAAGFFTNVLSLTSREGWPVEGSNAGEPVSTESLLSLSPAWGCVNLWCGVVGTLPWGVFRRDPRTGLPQEMPDHWLNLLLKSPNLDQTSVDFLEFITASLEMRGNAYVWKRRLTPGGRIISFSCIRPDFCSVRRSPSNGRLLYRFTEVETGHLQEVDQDEIWHIRGPGGSPLGGLSTIAFGRHAFGLSIATDKAASTTYRNGVRPSGVLRFKEWLKPERREAAHAKLMEDHTGAIAAGKPLVLEGGVEWSQISFSPQDAQLLESRAFSVEDICRWFQVPPILVGHSKDVTAWGSGIVEIVLGFVKFGLRRRVKRLEKSMEQQLLSAEERGQGYYIRFDMEGLLRGDPKARADFYEIMTRIGVYTIDDCREKEGMPPYPNGIGSVPRLQAQYVPLGVNVATGEVAMLPAPSPANRAPSAAA